MKLLRSLGARKSRAKPAQRQWQLDSTHVVWAVGSLCALNRIPFDADLLLKQFPPPYTTATLIHAFRALGFRTKLKVCEAPTLGKLATPCLALLASEEANLADAADNEAVPGTHASLPSARIGLITDASPERVQYFEAGTNVPIELPYEIFARRYLGVVFFVAKDRPPMLDPDVVGSASRFGFRWFVPELLKHKIVWRDVLLASLVMQLLALGMPLFTQTIIDKVVVHRTESTLVVIAIGMAVFMIFSAILTWVRQCLVLHTGNRVDAVLAASVFDHLFKLPPRYFEKRPTGVIAARLHGVEIIREFIASAAVTLVLDLPFLLIFVGIMFWYSVKLTLVALAILAVIALISALVAPLFQSQLNHQFLLGARNQAFVTEYVAGVETVKSLQMEPILKARFSDYLADYLHATFQTRQLANSYNTAATTLEQLMSLSILVVGAYMVMSSTEFTIGMLVAFQMFAGKLSQPMMRLVGLWQQFQQASLSVKRLGDVMNAPTEPYAVTPSRMAEGKGLIEIEGLAFRHSEKHPYLYRDFNLTVLPGGTVRLK
ncbi:ABC transporter transmembrane domain-containing protein, partial [Caldimonas sp.]|uniref:ABC transporter transmembrane domain-containing protein n=1 Tax=Caldimonas sp. TaxID=2838790 RepID=UPI00307E6B2E